VIKVDVTSYTDVNDYLPYQVPEVWLFKKNQSAIYHLQGDRYIVQPNSHYFPNLDLLKVITEYFRVAYEGNTSGALRECGRNWRARIKS
jgi:hypothetical protein